MKGLGLAVLLVAGLSGACTTHNTLAPEPVPAPYAVPSDLTYAINIPDPSVVFDLLKIYPDGVHTSPIEAQRRWDYTATYHGSPNVYFGATAPQCQYPGVGIVVAPYSVAALLTFTAADWPGIGLERGLTYAWVGRFVYTRAAAPGEYMTGALCAQVGR